MKNQSLTPGGIGANARVRYAAPQVYALMQGGGDNAAFNRVNQISNSRGRFPRSRKMPLENRPTR